MAILPFILSEVSKHLYLLHNWDAPCVFLENPLPESPLSHVGNVILDTLKNLGLYPTPQPNYEELTELYLSNGVAALNSSILVWLNENYGSSVIFMENLVQNH